MAGVGGAGVAGNRVMTVNWGLVTQVATRYVEHNFTSMVRVSRMSATVPSTDGTVASAERYPVYEGMSRVYEVTGPMTLSLGDEPVFLKSSYCTIPAAASVPVVNDMVEVVTHPDPKMVGRVFKVTSVDAGGQIPAGHRMQLAGTEQANRPADAAVPAEWRV